MKSYIHFSNSTTLSDEHTLSDEGSAARMQSFAASEEDDPQGHESFVAHNVVSRNPGNLTASVVICAERPFQVAEETSREVDWAQPGPVPREVFDQLRMSLARYQRTIDELNRRVSKARRQFLEQAQWHKAEKEDLEEKIQTLEDALDRSPEATMGNLRTEEGGSCIRKSDLSQNRGQISSQYPQESIHTQLAENIIGIILDRAELAVLRKDWRVLESHCERALEFATPLNNGPLIAHCEFYRAIALLEQRKWEFANEAFLLSQPCINIHVTPRDWDFWTQKLELNTGCSPTSLVHRSTTKSNPLVGESPISGAGWENLGDISSISSRPQTPEDMSETSSLNTSKPTPRAILKQTPEQLSYLSRLFGISESDSSSGRARPEGMRKLLGWIPGVLQRGKSFLEILWPLSSHQMASKQPITKPIPDYLELNVVQSIVIAHTLPPGKLVSNSDLNYPIEGPFSPQHFDMEQENSISLLEHVNEDTSWEIASGPPTLVSNGRLTAPWRPNSNSTTVENVLPNPDLLSDLGSTTSMTQRAGPTPTPSRPGSGPDTNSDSTKNPYFLGNLARLSKYFSLLGTNLAPESSYTLLPFSSRENSIRRASASTQSLSPPVEGGQSFSRPLFTLSDTISSNGQQKHLEQVEIEECARSKPSWGFPPIFGKLFSSRTPSATEQQAPQAANRVPLTADALLQLGEDLRRADAVVSAASKPQNTVAKSAAVRSVRGAEGDWDRKAEVRDDERKAVSEYWGWKGDSGLRVRVAVPSKKDTKEGVWDGFWDGKNSARKVNGEVRDTENGELDVTHELWNTEEAMEEEEKKGRKGLFWTIVDVMAEPFRRREVMTEEDWGLDITQELWDVEDAPGEEVEKGSKALLWRILDGLAERFKRREVMTEEDW